MTNSITNRQMFFILVLTLTSYSVVDISRAMAKSAGTGGWITILATSIIFGLAAMVIVYLNNLFKGKMLFDYSKMLVGRAAAHSIIVFYILYFLLIVVFLILSMGKLLKADFFPRTPIWAMMLISVPVFYFIAFKGITTIARMCEIFGVVFLVIAITVHIFMISQGKIVNIRPIFNSADIGKYIKAIKESIFPFLGIEVLLAIPMTQRNAKRGVRTAFFAVFFIGLFYILIVESSIMIVGINDIVNYNDSLIIAIRDMSLSFLDFLERFDILFLTIGFMGMYMGISIVITVIVEYLCKIFVRTKRLTIVIVLGVYLI